MVDDFWEMEHNEQHLKFLLFVSLLVVLMRILDS